MIANVKEVNNKDNNNNCFSYINKRFKFVP